MGREEVVGGGPVPVVAGTGAGPGAGGGIEGGVDI